MEREQKTFTVAGDVIKGLWSLREKLSPISSRSYTQTLAAHLRPPACRKPLVANEMDAWVVRGWFEGLPTHYHGCIGAWIDRGGCVVSHLSFLRANSSSIAGEDTYMYTCLFLVS